MFATDSERCTIRILKFYLSKRPLGSRNNGKFYLSVTINPSSEMRYKKVSMGINATNNLMKKIIKKLTIKWYK